MAALRAPAFPPPPEGGGFHAGFSVTLNGAKLRLCHTADEERGEAVCYVEDLGTGNMALDPVTRKPREETVDGGVRIIRPSPEAVAEHARISAEVDAEIAEQEQELLAVLAAKAVCAIVGAQYGLDPGPLLEDEAPMILKFGETILPKAPESQHDYPGLAEHEEQIETAREAGIPAYYVYRDVALAGHDDHQLIIEDPEGIWAKAKTGSLYYFEGAFVFDPPTPGEGE